MPARSPEEMTRKVVTTGDLAITYGDWTLRGANADGTWRYVIDDPYSG